MAKSENPKSYSTLGVTDVAELLGVTDRQVRNWIKDKGLPAKADPRGFSLDWPTALEWYVAYRTAQNPGSGGNHRPRAGAEPDPDEPETYNAAVLRMTVAQADLKELQLAREQAEVVAIKDVERVLAVANKSIQTQIMALPSTLTPQLIGMDDRTRMFAVIKQTTDAMLSNLAKLDAVRESAKAAPEDVEE